MVDRAEMVYLSSGGNTCSLLALGLDGYRDSAM